MKILIRERIHPKVRIYFPVALSDSFLLFMVRDRSRSDALRSALQAIRRKRGLRAKDVAKAMGLPLRSYEHFESGATHLSFDRVAAFAAVTDSDPLAILAAVLLDAPDFAARCADNKLGLILGYAVQDFDRDLGDGIERLEAATLIKAFGEMFQGLSTHVRDADRANEAWLEGRPKGRPAVKEDDE